jgi:hypothetical protein
LLVTDAKNYEDYIVKMQQLKAELLLADPLRDKRFAKDAIAVVDATELGVDQFEESKAAREAEAQAAADNARQKQELADANKKAADSAREFAEQVKKNKDAFEQDTIAAIDQILDANTRRDDQLADLFD